MTRRELQPELLRERAAEYTTAVDPAVAAAYRERLRLALQDPAFRSLPGFPIAEDDAILALSDPPYYTACPNPFLPEVMAAWATERAALRTTLGLSGDDADYHRDPFAADVSEGKNDPIYNAHSYHTKVPHKAIMRYILHYTEPGDVVLDGFCGTGMTGVAVQLCADSAAVTSLGYRVDESGVIYDGSAAISRLGARKAALTDLSPAATFIAYNYNMPVDAQAFEREARRILAEVEDECGWMYETRHSDGQTVGRINYTVWSDVFLCPQCHGEMVFWDVAVDQSRGEVSDEWDCPHCKARLCKNPRKASAAQRVERAFASRFDRALGQSVRQARHEPVLISYSVGEKRFEKRPDAYDLSLIQRIDEQDIPYWFPVQPMMQRGEQWGDTWRAGYHAGITNPHHFYTRRNLWALASAINRMHGRRTLFVATALIRTLSIMFRWAPNQKHTAGTSGTLYVPSVSHEYPIFDAIRRRLRLFRELLRLLADFELGQICVSTGSTTSVNVPPASIDYVFVDPPFGSNLMYSELNFIGEAWLQVLTNNKPEAIVNQSQRKGLPEYQAIMEACFREFYRVLKPGRWMTVEFHNSQNAVWNAIQEAILRAGFMVADVRTLDKQQGSFKQVTSTAAVKQDLVISAYKPDTAFEERFLAGGGSIDAAWDFARQHLEQLPVPQVNAQGVMEVLAERQPYLLFDRMVAFHIQRGLAVPLSAPEFYQGLRQRFLESDGMVFTPLQRAEYDKRRMQAAGVAQLALFVNDERSAIQWLQRELATEDGASPQTYQELQPKFLRELHQARHEDLPELRTLLEENFLQHEDGRWYVPDPERQEDMERLRQKNLLREFGVYLRGRGRLRTFRSEAIRAGFSDAWKRRDYGVIVQVAERLPSPVIEEDANLLMYMDNARLRLGQEPQQAALF